MQSATIRATLMLAFLLSARTECQTQTPATSVVRTARYLGDQGCVTLPIGENAVHFTPVKVRRQPPDTSTQPWPMGDLLPTDPLPAELDPVKVKRAVDAAFHSPKGMTAAFVVTWRGRLIGERYGENITMRTPLESWSMGKSVTATLMGILIRQGVYKLWQLAPIPEWQGAGDPRARCNGRLTPWAAITIPIRC